MKQLIIAEKPSLARSVIDGIGSGAFSKKDGYYESGLFIVSYAFGHLFSLCPLEGYLPAGQAKEGWSMRVLPFFPGQGKAEDYRFELVRGKGGKGKHPDPGVKKQFMILQKLMNRKDVAGIVHCGDADREGEVIIRLIIREGLKSSKPVYRLWLPDQTQETIRYQLSHMKEDSAYDNLYREGMCRMIMDWMYGINLSRYVTLQSRDRETYAIGRVLTPIVKAVYERDMEISQFHPETYYQAESVTQVDEKKIRLVCEKKFRESEKDQCDALCEKLNAASSDVIDVSHEDYKKSRGKLYSLSKLQSRLAEKYKMPMDQSLSLVQALYEKGYVTYPRTNTEYLSENEKERIQDIIEIFNKEQNGRICFREGKTIFDDEKIESHSAITPTGKRPVGLTQMEALVYEEIRNRFFAVFCKEDCIITKTEVTISCAGEFFTLKGEQVRQKGFLVFDPQPVKDELPEILKGDTIDHHFETVEKQTQPQKHYTTKTLTEFLKHPFRKDAAENEKTDIQDYNDIRAGTQIGTEATRTAIITKAIHFGYISQKGDSYRIEKKGMQMLYYLNLLHVDMSLETSVSMQAALKSVYEGEADVDDVLLRIKAQIQRDIRGR